MAVMTFARVSHNAHRPLMRATNRLQPIAMRGVLEKQNAVSGREYYRARVRLKDKSLARVDVPEPTCFDKEAANAHLDLCQAEEDETHAIYRAKLARLAREKGENGETCNQWYKRYFEARATVIGGAKKDADTWGKWISKHIGEKLIREVTADDIENIRDDLNDAITAYELAGCMKGPGRLAPKTAQNVWAALTTPMKFASTRKGPRELRVREDLGNPCLGIPPPRVGASKRRHWLRPTQFAKLIAWLAARDRDWAEAISVGLYLHLRPGELHELRVRDLVLTSGEARIERAYDEESKTITTPKSNEGVRTVTIPTTLMPLLERIAKERKANDRVCPIVAATPEKSRAGIFREFLEAASIDDEPAFFVESATHLKIDFRSIRDSGITWRFLNGERAEVVQREAGHEELVTTLGYAREVHDRRGRYGEPFPPLPAALLESIHPVIHPAPKAAKSWSGRGDLNRPNEDEVRESTSSEVIGSSKIERPSARHDVSERRVDRQVDHVALTRLAAKARILEQLSSGDQRVLASELREQLEALVGPNAEVIAIDDVSRRRRE